jgi:hypothetical protein
MATTASRVFAAHDDGVDGGEKARHVGGAFLGHVEVVERSVGPGDIAIERDAAPGG